MEKVIAKTRSRYEKMKPSPSRDVILRTVLPLFSRMDEKLNGHLENIDANFVDVFSTLNIANDENFIALSQALVANMADFIDRLMVDAGYFKKRGENTDEYEVAEDIPEEVKEKLLLIQAQNVEWYAQYQAVLEIEALEDEEFDDDDDPEGDDEEGGEGGEEKPTDAPSTEEEPLSLPPDVSTEEKTEAANAGA